MKHLLLVLLTPILSSVSAWASTCETGRQQSPIDITTPSRQKLPPLTFDYRASPLKIAGTAGYQAAVRRDESCAQSGVGQPSRSAR